MLSTARAFGVVVDGSAASNRAGSLKLFAS
jgi:hypothetical protein